MKMNGSQLIMKLLERQGIEVIAGIPGGTNLPLYDALYDSPIRHVLARHEQGAGFMAQGMARSTGKAAVCFGTSGPGATNLLTAIADAYLDSIPIIAITGQVPSKMIGTDAFQEIDMYGLTIPITKHNYLVRSAAELLEVIPEAFTVALSGRPGPVVVDVPKDVQLQVVEFDEWPEPGRAEPLPTATDAQIDELAEMLRIAKRPMFYIGGGVIASDASAVVRTLSEKLSIPVVATLMGLGAMPHDHPLFLGMLGMHGARFTNMLIEECDLLIGAGARFGDRATGLVSKFCPNAAIAHIDVDASELGKIKTPHLAIEADVKTTLEALDRRVATQYRPEWMARVAELRSEMPMETPGSEDPFMPYGAIIQAANRLPDDAIICTDVGQHQMWTAQAYPFSFPRQFLTSGGLGTMGFGMPAAIGAALANPHKTVVSFSGDGSILMNLQELATAVEQNVNVKVIVFNNGYLGLVRQQQELFYRARYVASQFTCRPDFVAIARAFGARGVDLGESGDPYEALAQALRTPGPCLISIPIPAEENVFPMVPPGAANVNMIGAHNYDPTRV